MIPWPRPAFVPPDPEWFVEAQKAGNETVRIAAVDQTGAQPIVTVVVRPVTLTEQGTPVLHTSLEVTLVLEHVSDDQRPTPVPFASKAQAERWVELARSRVLNPSAVIDLGGIVGR